MSSLSFTPKTKIHPLTLTSQAVHQILKQAPSQPSSYKKIYPTVKYATQEIRSTAQINGRIHKKIKQMDRIYSENKKTKLRPEFCQTQVTQHNIKFFVTDNQQKRNQKRQKRNNQKDEKLLLFRQQQSKKIYDGAQKRSAQKYLNKINKIKSLKLKQYMRNKFAIDVKTIETTRQETNDNDMQKMESSQSPISNKNNNNNNNSKDKHAFRLPRSNYKSKIVIKFHKNNQEKINHSNSCDFVNQSKSVNKLPQQSQYHLQLGQRQGKEKDVLDKLQVSLQKVIQTPQKFEKTHFEIRNQVGDKSSFPQKSFTFTKNFIQEYPADIRFDRLKNQLNLILLSFGCKPTNQLKPLPSYTRNCFKYKYFVGSGNNKNLIMSVMKKRWWWTQANSMADAHFVWTQIKQHKIFEHCTKSAELKQKHNYKFMLKSTQNQTKKQKEKKKQQIIKNNRIFHQKSIVKYEQNISQLQNTKELKVLQIPKKIHNHYEGNAMIGNKKALFYYISQYCQYKGLNRYDYIPLTFHITGLKSTELNQLQKAMEENPGYWIVKPGENSNRGNGISLAKSFNEIRQQAKYLTSNTLIVQKYIENLFLYNSRKFDIRAYMIAVTIAGSTKFYWHNQGYIRTSSFTYNLKNYSDIFVHLTNDAVQCQSEKYSKYEEGNKLSYQQFQRYLDANHHNKKYEIKAAHEKMKSIAKLAVQATYAQINCSRLQYSFELFGLDFILDSQFRPWLIQVNTNPCLQLCAPVLERLIPQVIQNTLRLALDPVFQPCVQFPRTMSSCVPENIIQSNRFTLIFDDIFDRDQKWQKKIFSILNQDQWDEDDQLHQGDGQIINNL